MPEGPGIGRSQSPPPRGGSRSPSPRRGSRSESESRSLSPSPRRGSNNETYGGQGYRGQGYGGQARALSEQPRGTQREYDLQDRLADLYRSASAPARVLLEMEAVAVPVNLFLRETPETGPLIQFFRDRSESPDFSQSQVSQSQESELDPGLSTLREMAKMAEIDPLRMYEKMKDFLKGFGRVLLGATYTGVDKAEEILGLAIEKGGVALSIAARYASETLGPTGERLRRWFEGTAAIAKMEIHNQDEFNTVAALWRDHFKNLPKAGTVIRLVRAYGWTVLSRIRSFGSIVVVNLYPLLKMALNYLFKAPGSINYEATASFIIEIASLCLEYITGGLFPVGPGPNTIAQLIIFLMTVLALGDALKPKLGSAIDQAIGLLRRLLLFVGENTENVVVYMDTHVIPFLIRVYDSSAPLKDIFYRATGLIFDVGVHTIAFTQALTQVLTEFAKKTPEYAARLMEIVRMLEVRGRSGGLEALTVGHEPGGGAAPMEEDGPGGGSKGGRGGARKSRKSSRNKGKKSKSGGAKVKTAKRSTPNKKSKGKKAKKSKKN
jgi:hypothetical protein